MTPISSSVRPEKFHPYAFISPSNFDSKSYIYAHIPIIICSWTILWIKIGGYFSEKGPRPQCDQAGGRRAMIVKNRRRMGQSRKGIFCFISFLFIVMTRAEKVSFFVISFVLIVSVIQSGRGDWSGDQGRVPGIKFKHLPDPNALLHSVSLWYLDVKTDNHHR